MIGREYPDATLSQYNSLFDGTQIGFYGLMQGITQPTPELAQDWSGKMLTSLSAISSETPNFRSYVSTLDVDNDAANGTAHVILQRPELYTLKTDGVRFIDWLSDLANGRDVESVNPSDAPPSALGDSPSITDKIANLAEGDLSGKALTIKLGDVSGSVAILAQAPVAASGSFSIQLPGEAEVAPYLFDARPTLFGPWPEECDLSISPAAYKTLGTSHFVLYTDDKLVGELLYTSDPDSDLVYYVYVDRDVTITGPCTQGESAGFSFDIDMRKGWNTVVVDFAVLEFRSEKPDDSYEWLFPFCTIGCAPGEL